MLLVVNTCARPSGIAYVTELIQQVNESGWDGPRVLVSDGPIPYRFPRRGWLINECERKGQRANYWRSLRWAAAFNETRTTVLEDDVVLCKNFLQYADVVRWPEHVGFVSYFDGHLLERNVERKMHLMPAERFTGFQAVTWSQGAIDQLLRSREVARWPDPHCGDSLAAKILAGSSYALQIPNLVDHVGTDSITTPLKGLDVVGRRSRTFVGQDFDALSLLGRAA